MEAAKQMLRAVIPASVRSDRRFVLMNQVLQIQLPKLVRAQYDRVRSRVSPQDFLRDEERKYSEEFYRQRMSWYVARTTEVFVSEKVPVIDRLCREFQFTSVLDVACGIGLAVNHFAGKGYDVAGIDIATYAIRYAQRQYPELADRFQPASATTLPFPDASRDVVFSYSFLPHLATPLVDQAIAEMHRVSRRYTFHVTTLHKSGWLTSFQHHLTVRSRDWWVRRFEKAGFREVQLDPPLPTRKRVFLFEKAA
jgi:ubiquinone/menaquinone biosynthesis C-methylase UbiE